MNESLLVNTLGHSLGGLIFGIFLYLLVEDRTARRLRGSGKSMLAAGLACAWNIASLVVLGLGEGADEIASVAAALGFSVLSLLPAVLFDLSLPSQRRFLVRVGYGVSAVAIALHVAELLVGSDQFHQFGLILITAGFGTLTCLAAAAIVLRRDHKSGVATSRLVATMLLFLLAMSFVHYGGEHVRQVWSQELALHHAAMPLALLVLLQDYRFVLLDAFLRLLANVTLAAVFTLAFFEIRRRAIWGATSFGQALELAGACLALILFALLRERLQAVLTRLFFRKPDLEAQLRMATAIPLEETGYLHSVAMRFQDAMGSETSVNDDEELIGFDLRRAILTSELPRHRSKWEAQGVEVIVPLRFSSGKRWHLLLGRRSGGRRYLSEDLQVLDRSASVVVEQIDRFRESETRRLVAQAELRALQAQIHPHFLFNAFNTLYGIIPREATGARETVLNLADIFRYFLDTRKAFVSLEDELRIVRAYLEVERLRLGSKLVVEMDVEPAALSISIPILTLEPLVENAIKHGIAPKTEGGTIRVEACLRDRLLRLAVCDTGGGFSGSVTGSGVGIENVTRRLELHYGEEATLDIHSDSAGTVVSVTIPADIPEPAATAV